MSGYLMEHPGVLFIRKESEDDQLVNWNCLSSHQSINNSYDRLLFTHFIYDYRVCGRLSKHSMNRFEEYQESWFPVNFSSNGEIDKFHFMCSWCPIKGPYFGQIVEAYDHDRNIQWSLAFGWPWWTVGLPSGAISHNTVERPARGLNRKHLYAY